MNWAILAIIVPLILIGYLALVDWLNLYPWNDLKQSPVKERVIDSLLNYLPLLFISLAFSQPGLILRVVALVFATLYMIGHLNAWWVPYLVGASSNEREQYQRLFQRTYKVLPRIGDHPVPDAEHMVVGALSTLMLMASMIVCFL